MIAVDTNILVYAHRTDSPHHERAHQALTQLGESGLAWAVTYPSIHEFVAIVTHPRIYEPPSPMSAALDAVDALEGSPTCTLIGEHLGYLALLRRLLTHSGVVGPRVHDARIAAICLAEGVTELWTADRDFSYFPELRTRNPLTGPRDQEGRHR